MAEPAPPADEPQPDDTPVYDALAADQPEPPTEEAAPPEKSELVAQAIKRGIPSYVAWAMTDDALAQKLEA